jgi:hypothetical protein
LCPTDKPFSTGSECIACTAPTHLFNLTSKKCTNCTNGYDVTLHKCKPSKQLKPFSGAKDKIILQPNQNETDLNNYLNNGVEDCPATKPFSIGESCIQCTDPTPYFNLSSKSCASCLLNSTTHKCEVVASAPFSASKPRVVLSGNLTKTDLDKYYASNGIQCPSDKPFYDGKVCIQCANPTPYFDLATKKCVNCPAPSIFNQDTQKCEKPAATDVDSHI